VTDEISCRGLLDFLGSDLVPGNSSHIRPYSNSEEPIVARLQACMVALVQGATFQAADTNSFFGNLWLEYEIDLYVPGPPNGVN
jgi:hypothetical protein